jgi:hypothetical protein
MKNHISAPAGECYWRYEIAPRSDAKVQLLTKGRIATHGQWTGAYGEQFIAWAPMPKRDKKTEARLIAEGKITP